MAAPLRALVLVASLSTLAGLCLIAYRYMRSRAGDISLKDHHHICSDAHEHEEEKPEQPRSNYFDSSVPLTSAPHDPGDFLDPNSLSTEGARLLTDLLSANQRDTRKRKQALVTIANKAAFTNNHAQLQEAGCLRQLSLIINSYGLSLAAGVGGGRGLMPFDPEEAESALRAVNNLAMHEAGQLLLRGCVESLVRLSTLPLPSPLYPTSTRLAALEALTNLCATPSNHARCCGADSVALRALIDGAWGVKEGQEGREGVGERWDGRVRIQALRLIVNLSCDEDTITLLVDRGLIGDILLARPFEESDVSILMRQLTVARNILVGCPVDCGRTLLNGRRSQTLVARLESLVNHSDSDIQDLARSALDGLHALMCIEYV